MPPDVETKEGREVLNCLTLKKKTTGKDDPPLTHTHTHKGGKAHVRKIHRPKCSQVFRYAAVSNSKANYHSLFNEGCHYLTPLIIKKVTMMTRTISKVINVKG